MLMCLHACNAPLPRRVNPYQQEVGDVSITKYCTICIDGPCRCEDGLVASKGPGGRIVARDRDSLQSSGTSAASHALILGLRCKCVSLDGRVVRSTPATGPPTVSPSPTRPSPESPPRYVAST